MGNFSRGGLNIRISARIKPFQILCNYYRTEGVVFIYERTHICTYGQAIFIFYFRLHYFKINP